jgi:hypothetical protein
MERGYQRISTADLVSLLVIYKQDLRRLLGGQGRADIFHRHAAKLGKAAGSCSVGRPRCYPD